MKCRECKFMTPEWKHLNCFLHPAHEEVGSFHSCAQFEAYVGDEREFGIRRTELARRVWGFLDVIFWSPDCEKIRNEGMDLFHSVTSCKDLNAVEKKEKVFETFVNDFHMRLVTEKKKDLEKTWDREIVKGSNEPVKMDLGYYLALLFMVGLPLIVIVALILNAKS